MAWPAAPPNTVPFSNGRGTLAFVYLMICKSLCYRTCCGNSVIGGGVISSDAMLSTCSVDHFDGYCVVEMLMIPVVAVLAFFGALLLAYLGIWVSYSIWYSYVYIHYLAGPMGRGAKFRKMGEWAGKSKQLS